MKTAALLLVVIALGLAVGLAATNPTTEQYAGFLQASLERTLVRMGEGTESSADQRVLRDILRSQGATVIRSLTRGNTARHSYGLFSIFETNALGVRVQVLGIANRFIPLQDEDELVRQLGRLTL